MVTAASRGIVDLVRLPSLIKIYTTCYSPSMCIILIGSSIFPFILVKEHLMEKIKSFTVLGIMTDPGLRSPSFEHPNCHSFLVNSSLTWIVS